MNKYCYALIILSLTLVSGCKPQETKNQTTFQLVYSSNLNGELEPCGCSESGNLGGIKRRSSLVKQLRKQNPDLLLISAGGLLISDSQRDRLKSEYIIKGLQSLQYDVVGVQWRDLAYGAEFLQQNPLHWLSSNWLGDEFSKQKTISRLGLQFSFFSWLQPEESPWRKMQSKKRVVGDDIQALLQKIKKHKNPKVINVLFTDLPWKKLSTWDLGAVDILIIKANHEKFVEPKQNGQTLVLQAGSRGMRLGSISFQVNTQGRIENWRHKAIPMPKEIPDDPALQEWYSEYNHKVKQAYLARVAKKKAYKKGQSPYAGDFVCQSCHKKAHDLWSQSKHAQAFQALEEVNKAFDPDCIICHTLGFEQEGGYIDLRTTPDFINVQCENCHGAAKKHADSAGKVKTVKLPTKKSEVCGRCHNQSHSPDFEFIKYWGKIVHGK